MDFIMVPGFEGSGDSHWQTMWEKVNPAIRRFSPNCWDNPELEDWLQALENEVFLSKQPPVIIAHSLACLLLPIWAARKELPIAGAFLVAVPDPYGENFPEQVGRFKEAANITTSLSKPTLMIASSDDPYASLEYSEERANKWGAGFINIGEYGHINSVGDWPHGRMLLDAFCTGLK